MKTRVKLTIRGEVQGVFFRKATTEIAQRLDLKGWVRNCPDGSVEAVFEGEEKAVQDAVRWCHEGPSAAKVTSVDEEEQEYRGEFGEFSVRY